MRGRPFASEEHLRTELFDWVNWYNNCRLHSTLGYITQVGFREAGLSLWQDRQRCCHMSHIIPSTAASRRTPAAGPPRRRSGPSSTRRSPGSAISGHPPVLPFLFIAAPQHGHFTLFKKTPPQDLKSGKKVLRRRNASTSAHFPSERLNSAAIFHGHEKKALTCVNAFQSDTLFVL